MEDPEVEVYWCCATVCAGNRIGHGIASAASATVPEIWDLEYGAGPKMAFRICLVQVMYVTG